MELESASITILVGSDITRIEIKDQKSGTVFCSVQLTPGQLSEALSRISNTPCRVAVRGLDKLNKQHEHDTLTFGIPKAGWSMKDSDDLKRICLDACPEGWTPDLSFSSQGSFFSKDGKDYAKTIIRRWV